MKGLTMTCLVLSIATQTLSDKLDDIIQNTSATAIHKDDLSFRAVKKCNCVPFHMCPGLSGQGLIDIRINANPCEMRSEICCESPVENPLPSKQATMSCGKRNSKEAVSTNGNEESAQSAFGEFPWMVIIFKEEQDGSNLVRRFLCSGALIHENLVLTAAHCAMKLDLVSIRARAGEWDLNSKDEPQPHQDHEISEIIIHNQFNEKTLSNDVALIVTTEPFNMSSSVGTLCLAKPNELVFNSSCLAIGWGLHDLGKPSVSLSRQLVESRMFGGSHGAESTETFETGDAVIEIVRPASRLSNIFEIVRNVMGKVEEVHNQVKSKVEAVRNQVKNNVAKIHAHIQQNVGALQQFKQNLMTNYLPSVIFPWKMASWKSEMQEKEPIAQRNQMIPQIMELQLVSNADCTENLRSDANLGGKFLLHDGFMCARSTKTNTNFKGDATLVCPIRGEHGRYEQVGIASWSSGNKDDSPTVYLDVAKFKPWIDEQASFLGLTPSY